MRHVLGVWRSFWSRSGRDRIRLVTTAWQALRQQGLAQTMRQGARLVVDRDAENRRYAEWCRRHTPDATALRRMSAAADSFACRPLVSIITPVYNTDPMWLEAGAASVVAQAYPHWEWHIANDGSTDARTLDVLARLTSLDSRIRVHHLPGNLGISAASNVALAEASGEYVGLMDHDDVLAPHALFRVVEHLNRPGPRPDVLYTDEDKLAEDGRRTDAYFKPDWSPDHFLSNMYACHLLVFRRALAVGLGGFRSAFDFSQDYDLVLRLMERANRIDHIPDVLYHWRKVPQSTATTGDAKPTAHLAGRRALQDHLDRNHVAAHVTDAGPPGFYRIVYDLDLTHTVSIVGPFSVADREGLRARTSYPHLEFVDDPRAAGGDRLLFLDPCFEPQAPDWLAALLQVLRPGVGVVGSKLLRANGTLEHIGLVLGLDGVAGRPFQNAPADHGGYFGNAILIRTVAAVSGACLLTPRATFDRVGGLTPGLGHEAAAIDFCLKVRDVGARVVVTPWSVLKRSAAAPVPALEPGDIEVLKTRWPHSLTQDPYYNPNLSRRFLDYRVGR